MQAKPATAPVSAPTRLGLPSRTQVIASQVHMAIEPAMSVLTNACEAMPLAARAEPALKPNQPNQSRPVPSATKAMLCGSPRSPLANRRLPTTKTEASAAKPALTWTTRPPAKSSTPCCASQPPPQIQWTNGTYTRMLQSTRNHR